jgi:hypothetical protein
MKKTTKQIKLADVFYEAANNKLSEFDFYDPVCSAYSCIAISNAAKKLAGEKENITFDWQSGQIPVSERWIQYNLTHWSKKAKADRPVIYAALKFAKEAGCPTGSSSAMQGVKQNKQHVRYQWLMTLAMLAEEENVVVSCKS